MPRLDIATPERIAHWKETGQVRKLIMALAEPECSHMVLIMHALQEMGDDASIALLPVLRLEETNTILLGRIIDLFGLLQESEAVEHIKDILDRYSSWADPQDPAMQIWISCVDALGKIASPQSLSILEEIATDPALDSHHRRRAIEGLSLANDPTIAERLSALWDRYSDASLRQAVISGIIVQAGNRTTPLAVLFNRQSDPFWRRVIVDTIGDHQALQYISHLLDWFEKEPDGDVLRSILEAFYELGDTRAYAPVRFRFDSLSLDTKLVAAKMLVSLGWQLGEKDNTEARVLHALGCGRLGDAAHEGAEATPFIIRYLENNTKALIDYTQSKPNKTAWWNTIAKLLSLKSDAVHAAMATLMEAPDLPIESEEMIAALREKLNTSR